ncbi:hypothetical protein ACT691_16420 [Vibrio metschnikovii]
MVFWLGKQALPIGELEINDSDSINPFCLSRQGSYELTSSMDAHKNVLLANIN